MRTILLVLSLCLAWPTGVFARDDRAPAAAAVASAHPLATTAGYEILSRGGNAFDAAVAVTAALSVVEPFSAGLGGGGFYLTHHAAGGRDRVIDARERAPGEAWAGMYLDDQGVPRPDATLQGPLAAGIPGVPAALAEISRRWGRLALPDVLAPAIALAEGGFAVDERYVALARSRLKMLQASPTAAAVFLDHGELPAPGWVLRQPQLARTLGAIARRGAAGFYAGPVAREMVRAGRAGGGIWTEADLRAYAVVERVPVTVSLAGGVRVTSAPPPSAGGIGLAQALQMLALLPRTDDAPAQRMHLVAEVLRRVYQDRARFLGDPDFVDMPVARLLSPQYAAERAAGIDLHHASPLPGDPASAPGGTHTTHFSLVDGEGNRVAATLSINTTFGSGFVAGNTGVLLNNEMDDFAVAPGRANAYGLVGTRANMIQPGKRPLSSMSPCFVEDARGVLVLGTPGGSRIVSMVLLAVLDYLHPGRPDPERIVSAPRYHHQYLPDRIEVEPGTFAAETLDELRAMGHRVETGRRKWGNMQAVFVERDGGQGSAASDPRGYGGPAWW